MSGRTSFFPLPECIRDARPVWPLALRSLHQVATVLRRVFIDIMVRWIRIAVTALVAVANADPIRPIPAEVESDVAHMLQEFQE